MKDSLKALGAGLWQMFHDYITSKKTLTAILTVVTGVLIKDEKVREHVLVVGSALIGGIAVADYGRAKAIASIATIADAPKEPTLFPPPAEGR